MRQKKEETGEEEKESSDATEVAEEDECMAHARERENDRRK